MTERRGSQGDRWASCFSSVSKWTTSSRRLVCGWVREEHAAASTDQISLIRLSCRRGRREAWSPSVGHSLCGDERPASLPPVGLPEDEGGFVLVGRLLFLLCSPCLSLVATVSHATALGWWGCVGAWRGQGASLIRLGPTVRLAALRWTVRAGANLSVHWHCS